MAAKPNYFTDNDDIAFHLNKRMDYAALFEGLAKEEREALGVHSPDEFRSMMTTVLETLGEICGTQIGPNAAQVEKEDVVLKDGEVVLPPTIVQNVQTLLEFGCATVSASPRFGGLGMPFLAELVAIELISRGCPSTTLNVAWFSAIAHIIEKFGTEEQKQRIVPRMTAGEWSGSMALTEPDAGSDLANLRTYAEKQADGSYKIYGTKRFISNGMGQVSLVLAMREKGKTGLDNISMYICLRKGDDGSHNFKVTKIEEKVGLHGSATCELAFDGAKAELIGEDGKGFQHMLSLMNDARISVGYQGLGLMEAVYRLAADYASQRKSWGKPIAQHELIAEKLLDMEVEIKAMRSLCYQAGMSQSLLSLGERALKTRKDLSDDERAALEKKTAKHRKRVRRWTPLVKWYIGECTTRFARTGLNIHGGYGFTKEYRAEYWVRESLILSLYEGTSQIQALMCVKDTLKAVIRRPTQFVEEALGLKVQKLRTRDPLKKQLYDAKQLVSSAVIVILMRLVKANVRVSISEIKPTELLRVVKLLAKDLVKMQDVGPALLQAERLCEMKALVAMAETLLWDAEADSSRRWLCERFLGKIMPRLAMLKSEIEFEDVTLNRRLYGASGAPDETAAAGGATN